MSEAHDTRIAVPTSYGQQIIDTLCNHLASSDYSYWVPPIGQTDKIVSWLSHQIGKPPKSVAGAVSNLITKELMNNQWSIERDSDNDSPLIFPDSGYLSVTPQGWYRWSKWSEENMQLAFGKRNSFYESCELEAWFEWDGIEWTAVGDEFALLNSDLFDT